MFCTINALVQCLPLTRYHVYPSWWLADARFLFGAVAWALGLVVNITSDSILINLRKPGETGYVRQPYSCRSALVPGAPLKVRARETTLRYKIPRGGMFEYVSGANFFGECLEWTGFALASWSVSGLAFAAFTWANIGPRALQHHKWYLSKFGSEYPSHRRALIPGVL